MPIVMPENLIHPPENAFENLIHPLERANFAEIQSSYSISLLLNGLGRLHADLTSLAEVPDRALIVTSKNFPRLYDAYKIAHDKLELKKDYDLFCNFEYNRNAKTLGTDDNCIIVVDSSCVEDFSDEQLRALLGRELAHVKYRHVKYLTAFNLIDYFVSFFPSVIANAGAVSALKGLLLDYLLAAQFTADRAGAFVAGNILPVIQNNLMTSGLETADECIDYELYTQADLPEELNHFDRTAKLLMTNTLRDFQIPFVIPRIRELVAWGSSDECREFLPKTSPERKKIPELKFQSPKKISAQSQSLIKGQRLDLSIQPLRFTANFELANSAIDIDIAAFLTQANGKVANDEDFVFYGNHHHKSGAVTHHDDDSIDIDLAKIPRHVEKISLTATIYDADKHGQNFSMIRNVRLKIFGLRGEIATFPLEIFTVETAIVLGEVYRYKGAWKFNAVGAGFNGGLAALCQNFGVKIQ